MFPAWGGRPTLRILLRTYEPGDPVMCATSERRPGAAFAWRPWRESAVRDVRRFRTNLTRCPGRTKTHDVPRQADSVYLKKESGQPRASLLNLANWRPLSGR